MKKRIIISCDNLRELETRANSCAKEPELIKWLENNMGPQKNFLGYWI